MAKAKYNKYIALQLKLEAIEKHFKTTHYSIATGFSQWIKLENKIGFSQNKFEWYIAIKNIMLTLNFSPFPTLYTDRLILRQINETDMDAFFAIRSNATVMKYIDKPLAKVKEDVVTLYNNITDMLTNNTGLSWAIQLKEHTEMIGHIGFWHIDAANHRGEVGYILQEQYYNKGYGSEALKAALHHAFSILQFHSVEANINPANEASRKILAKQGFVKEAYFKENYFFEGRFLDSEIYSLLTPLKKNNK